MDKNSVRWVYPERSRTGYPKNQDRPPFVNLVPLQEILSEVLKVGVGSKKVQTEYERLISILAPEFQILLEVELKEIEKFGGERLREAIGKVREGSIFVEPGYDGRFGVVKIWQTENENPPAGGVVKPTQESIF